MRTERLETESKQKLQHRPERRSGAGWWLIARDGAGRMEVLTVDGEGAPGEEALAVFSFEEEAEMFLRFGGLGEAGGWRTRESGAGELVSVLFGPCRDVGRVALDPMPEMPAATIELAGLSRERFLERVLGRGLGRGAAPDLVSTGR